MRKIDLNENSESNKTMSSSTSIKLMLSVIAIVILFHICILIKLIPYEITWGGRLKNDSEMYVFESISIAINLLLGTTLLIKGKYIKQLIGRKTVNFILWIFLILFGLNTIGNLFAETLFEKSFSILTFAFAILILKVLREKDNQEIAATS